MTNFKYLLFIAFFITFQANAQVHRTQIKYHPSDVGKKEGCIINISLIYGFGKVHGYTTAVFAYEKMEIEGYVLRGKIYQPSEFPLKLRGEVNGNFTGKATLTDFNGIHTLGEIQLPPIYNKFISKSDYKEIAPIAFLEDYTILDDDFPKMKNRKDFSQLELEDFKLTRCSCNGRDTKLYEYFTHLEYQKEQEKKQIEEDKKQANKDDFWNGKDDDNKNNDNNTSKDDFWNGSSNDNSNQKKTTKQQNQDGFWNGKDNVNKKTNSKKDDFWSGGGTAKENQQFENNTKTPKSNQFIGEIKSKTKSIIIRCRDHGTVDGDRVKIMLNNRVIESNLTLTDGYQTITINLDFGMNRIDFKALNEGSASPNTAEFIIKDDTGKLISSKDWNITTGYTATLLIVKL